MAIAAPVAGAYVGSYNRSSAGFAAMNYMRNGFTLSFSQKGERIEETDLYGLCLIDIVHRGSQLSIECIGKVYGAGVTGPLWPWAAPFGTVYNAGSPIGQLANTAPDTLLLTAVSGTPAASAGPVTLTSNVIISPDSQQQINFNSTLREVPLRFDALLQDTAGTGTLFTTT